MNGGETTTVTLPPRRRWWRRALRWVIRVSMVLVVIALLGWAVLSFVSSRMVQREIALIREAQQPVALQELLLPRPKVDEERDARPFYAAALELTRPTRDEHYDHMPRLWQSGEVSPELLELLRDDVQRNELALEMLDRAATMPQSSFEFGLWYGIGQIMPRLNQTRHLANVVSMRTVHLALSGDGDAAVDSLLNALPMLRMFEREPLLMVELTRMGVYARLVEDARVVLSFSSPSDRALLDLEAALRESEQAFDVRQMWLAERAYSMEVMRPVIGAAVGAEQVPLVPERADAGRMAAPVGRLMLVGQLRMYRRLIELPDAPWHQRLDLIHGTIQQRQGWPIGLFADITGPSLLRGSETYVRMLATSRSMRAAVMIEQLRRERGRLPESLDEIPAIVERDAQMDPFTGDHLLYRRTERGYVVYSVGPDLRDDGGPWIDGSRVNDFGVHVRVGR